MERYSRFPHWNRVLEDQEIPSVRASTTAPRTRRSSIRDQPGAASQTSGQLISPCSASPHTPIAASPIRADGGTDPAPHPLKHPS